MLSPPRLLRLGAAIVGDLSEALTGCGRVLAVGQAAGGDCEPLNQWNPTMLEPAQLAQTVQRIAEAASRPVTVIVFGSYARGDASEASDLDLVVIEPELPDKGGEYLRLKAAVGRIGVGVDLPLYARSDFERWSQVPGTFPYWAKKEGRALYDASAWQ